MGIFADFDIFVAGNEYLNDTAATDMAHNLIWIENTNTPNHKAGLMRKPVDDLGALAYAVDNPTSVYNAAPPVLADTLRKWFSTPLGTVGNDQPAPDDKSVVLGVSGVILGPGEKYLDEYIFFQWDEDDVPFDKTVWKVWLRQNGFYRGDVNTDNRGHERDLLGADLGLAPNGGGINVVDVVYLANSLANPLYKEPMPYKDQGDVNADGLVTNADVIYLANYIFKPALGMIPKDRNRFLPASLASDVNLVNRQRDSINENPDWK
jgi:hypothetical protein